MAVVPAGTSTALAMAWGPLRREFWKQGERWVKWGFESKTEIGKVADAARARLDGFAD